MSNAPKHKEPANIKTSKNLQLGFIQINFQGKNIESSR